MPKVHKTCIYSKKSKKIILIVKSNQTCIYSKNQKNQKSQTLCGTDWHRWIRFWFFWVYAGFGDFSLSKLWFFEYMQVLCTFGIKMLFFEYMQVLGLFRIKMFVFFEYMQVWGTSGSQNLHILKKIKVLIVKSHQTYIYSKKIKTSQTLCCIDELVLIFWILLSICRFCVRFWHQNVDLF